mmetsp:Transcript_11933/g.38210  ORF Transcript_11933/g.38210 Transcript_11933/m.38210 type:complete len:419 (-) Transcript_11933:45-1301(-)
MLDEAVIHGERSHTGDEHPAVTWKVDGTKRVVERLGQRQDVLKVVRYQARHVVLHRLVGGVHHHVGPEGLSVRHTWEVLGANALVEGGREEHGVLAPHEGHERGLQVGRRYLARDMEDLEILRGQVRVALRDVYLLGDSTVVRLFVQFQPGLAQALVQLFEVAIDIVGVVNDVLGRAVRLHKVETHVDAARFGLLEGEREVLHAGEDLAAEDADRDSSAPRGVDDAGVAQADALAGGRSEPGGNDAHALGGGHTAGDVGGGHDGGDEALVEVYLAAQELVLAAEIDGAVVAQGLGLGLQERDAVQELVALDLELVVLALELSHFLLAARAEPAAGGGNALLARVAGLRRLGAAARVIAAVAAGRDVVVAAGRQRRPRGFRARSRDMLDLALDHRRDGRHRFPVARRRPRLLLLLLLVV